MDKWLGLVPAAGAWVSGVVMLLTVAFLVLVMLERFARALVRAVRLYRVRRMLDAWRAGAANDRR